MKSGFMMLLLKECLDYIKDKELGVVEYKKGKIEGSDVDDASYDEESY